MRDSTTRFSDRVENYVKYRPSYPVEVLDILKSGCDLDADTVIADMGSGTGILAKLFLENGNRVLAVEPNDDMREAARDFLGKYSGFTSISATAENSQLADNSVDLIVAGQAFHWFDVAKSKLEFLRILRPGGWGALIWNSRQIDSTPFLRGYESLLQEHATDYEVVDQKNVGEDTIASFFHPESFKLKPCHNNQLFDYEGLRGRCLSSSYSPNEGAPGYEALIAALRELYEKHQMDGIVSFEYETQVFYGQLA